MPSETYIPPRFWWLRRIGFGSGLLVVTLAAARLCWGCYAERQLRTAIAAYVATGEPFRPEDFPVTSPSDPPAGLELLAQAPYRSRLPIFISVTELLALRQDKERWPQWEHWLGDYLEAAQPTLELMREARSLPRHVFRAAPTYRGTGSWTRPDARLCCVAAWNEHNWVNDRDALKYLRDALAVGSEVLWRSPHTVSVIVDALTLGVVFETLEDITPDLKLAVGAHPYARDEALDLLHELCDESGLRTAWVLAMQGERAILADGMRQGLSGGPVPQIRGLALGQAVFTSGFNADWLLALLWGPASEIRVVELMRYYSECSQVAEHLVDLGYEAESPRAPGAAGFLDSLAKGMLQPYDPVYAMRVELAYRRMMACALAIRLYEVDNGARPPSLSALVPTYLQAIPLDPFAPDKRPIAYRPGAEQPVLYSVGDDGLDQGGTCAFQGLAQPLSRTAGDRVMFLDGGRPSAPTPTWLPDEPPPLPDDE